MKKNKELDAALLAALSDAFGDEDAKELKKGKGKGKPEGMMVVEIEAEPAEKEVAPEAPKLSPHDEMMKNARAAEEVCSLADRIRDMVMKKKGKVEDVEDEE